MTPFCTPKIQSGDQKQAIANVACFVGMSTSCNNEPISENESKCFHLVDVGFFDFKGNFIHLLTHYKVVPTIAVPFRRHFQNEHHQYKYVFTLRVKNIYSNFDIAHDSTY